MDLHPPFNEAERTAVCRVIAERDNGIRKAAHQIFEAGNGRPAL